MTATLSTPQTQSAERYQPTPSPLLTPETAYELVTCEAAEYALNTDLHSRLGLEAVNLTEGRLPGPHTWLFTDQANNPVNNFKLNGAGNAVAHAAEVLPAGGTLIAASAGNWGQAVIRAAGLFGYNVRLYVPANITDVKEAAAREHAAQSGEHGIELELIKQDDTHGRPLGDVDQAIAAATKFAERQADTALMHPFDNVYGVAGQARVPLGIIDRLMERAEAKLWHPFESRTVITVPRGGGSLLAATAFTVAQARRKGLFGDNVEVHAAVPYEGIDMERFDGLNVRQQGLLGTLATRDRCFVQDTTGFSEADTGRALDLIAHHTRRRMEPSGAAATAAVLAEAYATEQPTTFVSVLSGANGTPERYAYFRNATVREQQERLNRLPRTPIGRQVAVRQQSEVASSPTNGHRDPVKKELAITPDLNLLDGAADIND